MNLFFDTSALIKFYHQEEGTENVTNLILSPDNTIWISELARIEFYSALYRRYRNKEISDIELTDATTGFDESLNDFNVEPLGQIIVRESEILIKTCGKEQGLRTLDSLHLATFNLICEENWSFVVCDNTLFIIAKHMGFNVLNPLNADNAN